MRLLSHAVLWLMRLVAALPLAWQAALGSAMGRLLYRLGGARRRVALRNLELCLPQLDAPAREALAREHFYWLARSLLERGLLWYASHDRLRRLIHVEGDVGYAERCGRPMMWLTPHFVGLDIGGAAVQLYVKRPAIVLYQPQSNPVFDAALRAGRLRFGHGKTLPRHGNVMSLIRAIRGGDVFVNLPDMDFGNRDAAMVPFFGVPAATLLAPARLARALGMVVQPLIVELLPGGQGYRVRFLPPWEDFPGADDDVAATRRVNAFIEEQIRAMPAQYLWVHRRFKTRPEGEPPLY
ncbi:MAG: lipid A biosynthesis acyltransferase [Aquabacterium sp.]